MIGNDILARYLDAVLRGDRPACRRAIEEALQSGIPANAVYADVIWPMMAQVEQLRRTDRITAV
ncbi:MAG: B12-binding domain-containing protein, partial [Planctomycetota bacterium]